jgi:hypothetical protein
MSTLVPTADRAAAVGASAKLLLRGPRLVWAALFLNVLAFFGLKTVIPIPTSGGQMLTQGFARPRIPTRAHGEPPRRH